MRDRQGPVVGQCDQGVDPTLLGMELRVPMGGNKTAEGQLQAARDRRKQSLLEIQYVERELVNAVDTALRGITSAAEQVADYEGIVDQCQMLLDLEVSRLKAGLSNSRVVLQRDDDLIKALEDKVRSVIAYKKACTEFDLIRGWPGLQSSPGPGPGTGLRPAPIGDGHGRLARGSSRVLRSRPQPLIDRQSATWLEMPAGERYLEAHEPRRSSRRAGDLLRSGSPRLV